MSPQLSHALKEAGVMMLLAAVAVLIEAQTGIIRAAGLDPLIFGPIIGALLAAAKRLFEGWRDQIRAEEMILKPEDVGYNILVASEPDFDLAKLESGG